MRIFLAAEAIQRTSGLPALFLSAIQNKLVPSVGPHLAKLLSGKVFIQVSNEKEAFVMKRATMYLLLLGSLIAAATLAAAMLAAVLLPANAAPERECRPAQRRPLKRTYNYRKLLSQVSLPADELIG
jgi:hypothetical protein